MEYIAEDPGAGRWIVSSEWVGLPPIVPKLLCCKTLSGNWVRSVNGSTSDLHSESKGSNPFGIHYETFNTGRPLSDGLLCSSSFDEPAQEDGGRQMSHVLFGRRGR